MPASSGTAATVVDLPHLLLEEALAADPMRVQPWTPGEAAPAELLRLTRDGTGAVTRMHWATYRFTRRQETFDRGWVSEPR